MFVQVPSTSDFISVYARIMLESFETAPAQISKIYQWFFSFVLPNFPAFSKQIKSSVQTHMKYMCNINDSGNRGYKSDQPPRQICHPYVDYMQLKSVELAWWERDQIYTGFFLGRSIIMIKSCTLNLIGGNNISTSRKAYI